jgi:uncharacterized protein (TIGR00156 family)
MSGVEFGSHQILKKPVDDQDVVLRGNILRKVDDDEYIFSDGTGEIRAKIDDDDLPAQVSEKTKVEIPGEVDVDNGRAKIDVEKVIIIG